MDKHLQCINGFRCSNKQDVTLFPTETDIGCPLLGNGEMGYLLAILIENGHTVASKIDVSTVVDCHSVRSGNRYNKLNKKIIEKSFIK